MRLLNDVFHSITFLICGRGCQGLISSGIIACMNQTVVIPRKVSSGFNSISTK